MCLSYRSHDSKTHRVFVAGQLSIVAAGVLMLFGQDIAPHYADPIHFLRGFLLGMGIVFLISSTRRTAAARS